MANNENLKPIRSKSEAREKGRNGGIKSGIKRKERKTMREMLDYLLMKQAPFSIDGEMTNLEAIMISTIEKAIQGDIRAVQFIRDTIGEKPTDKQEINTNTYSLFEQEIENKAKELLNKK